MDAFSSHRSTFAVNATQSSQKVALLSRQSSGKSSDIADATPASDSLDVDELYGDHSQPISVTEKEAIQDSQEASLSGKASQDESVLATSSRKPSNLDEAMNDDPPTVTLPNTRANDLSSYSQDHEVGDSASYSAAVTPASKSGLCDTEVASAHADLSASEAEAVIAPPGLPEGTPARLESPVTASRSLSPSAQVQVVATTSAEPIRRNASGGRSSMRVEQIIAADEGNRSKRREVQMVLDTSGASWNMKRGGGSITQPSSKRIRRDGSSDVQTSATGSSNSGKSAQVNMRAQLRGFAMIGSQPVKPADDDIEDGEKATERPLWNGEGRKADSNDRAPEQEDAMAADGPPNGSLPDEAMDVDRDVGGGVDSSVYVQVSSPPQVIDLTDGDPQEAAVGPTTVVMDTSSSSVAETSPVPSEVSKVEIVRTNTSSTSKLAFDLARVSRRWGELQSRLAEARSRGASSPIPPREIAGDGGGLDDENAAESLSRVLSKEDFLSMEVLGQFNLGFIIARRRKQGEVPAGPSSDAADMDDLFIIDQHAADEKYNFETLQLTTKIESQKLYRCVACGLIP